MYSFKKLADFYRQNSRLLSFLLLLLVCFAYFTYFQSSPTFADPDTFYHIKMAQLLPQQGIIKEFPWLQATVLKNSYIDQHFLYHVFLIPFVTVIDPIPGAKLANIFLATTLVILFYWLLLRYKVRLAILFVLLLLVTTPFIFRINLVKAPVFSIIILLIGMHWLFQYRYLGIFFLSFVYVWAYGGFILILVLSALFTVAGLSYEYLRQLGRRTKSYLLGNSRELRLFLASLAGVAVGLIVNPYFPQNMSFYWNQLVKIGIINYQNIISVGNEWYPYHFFDLISGTALLTIFFLLAVFLFFSNLQKLAKKDIFLFLTASFFLAFTLKSRRYVEYYVPWAVLFNAFVISRFGLTTSWRRARSALIKVFNGYGWPGKAALAVLGIYFVVVVPAMAIKDIRQTKKDFNNGISVRRFANSATWLRKNTKPGEIVFHSSWDEFPILFYNNSQNYYIAGLDPTFTYEYSHEMYEKMVDITTGRQYDNLYHDITKVFGASYIFIEVSHSSMRSNLVNDGGFKKVYEDSEAYIYKAIKK